MMFDTLKEFFGRENGDEGEDEDYIEYDPQTEETKKLTSTGTSFAKVDSSPIATWSEQENSQLEEIFSQLHETDNRIAETRHNTFRLAIETRLMLNDLRKQLG